MHPYYAPAFQIDVDGSRLHADVSALVEQVRVVSSPDSVDQFSFTLANTVPTLRWTHTDDAQLFAPGSSVRIQMGYVGDLHDMMEGEVTHVSPSFPASGVPTVLIEGHSRMHRLQGQNKTRTFQDTTPQGIAEQIGREAGLDVQAEDAALQQEYVMQPNQSDLGFLKDLARMLHFEVLVKGRTLIFRKSQECDASVLTYIWYGPQESFAPAPDTLPLKSFSPQMNTLAPATQVQFRSYDVQAKKAFVSNASVDSQVTCMGGRKAGATITQTAFGVHRSVVHVTRPFASQEEGDLYANSAFNAKAMGFVS